MSLLRSLAVSFGCLIAFGARAAPLPDPGALPPPDSPIPVVSDANCPLKAPESPIPIELHVRNAPRQIGPYAVMLPGYSSAKDDPYAPYLIKAKPGDSLLINVVNELSAPVNLHTHGVVTDPRPYSRPCNMPGDYVLDTVQPNHNLVYRFDIPKTVIAIGEGATPVVDNDNDGDDSYPFPVGAYWIHSHIHGSAKNDVWAGQSAVLDIEKGEGSSQPVIDKLHEMPTKILALRELQLAVPQGQYPDKVVASAPAPGATLPDTTLTAQWINGDGYDTRACQEFYRPGVTISHGLGYCASNGVPAAQADQPLDTSMDRLWLFTVNGAVGPSLDLDAGLTRLKIVNLSSVVTYVLDLVPEGCGAGCDDAERAFQLAKVDGVVTSAANPAIASLTAKAQTREPFIKISRLLLLPASRAEILIPNSDPHADDQKYVLRTRGFETGGAGQDVTDYQGDPWPAVDLASVTLKPVASASPPANALKDLLGTGFRVRLMSQEKTNARNDMAKTAPPPVPHNCLALPDDTYRRRITLTQTASEFRIGSDIVDNKGDPAPSGGNPDPNHIAPIAFEHGAPPLSIPHVCAKLGTEEIWEVVNTTNELHNFHVHQTKFRLATAGGRTAPPSLPPGYTDAMAIEDPKNVIENQLGETGRVPSGVKNVDIWHDTLPVPPASFDTDGTMLKPGRIFVRIPFYDPHQVGTYVFHCHILEHEDKGMMEVMEVYDPLHPDAIGKAARYSPRNGAGGSRLAFCGAPPTDAALLAPAPRSWAQDIAARFVRAGD